FVKISCAATSDGIGTIFRADVRRVGTSIWTAHDQFVLGTFSLLEPQNPCGRTGLRPLLLLNNSRLLVLCDSTSSRLVFYDTGYSSQSSTYSFVKVSCAATSDGIGTIFRDGIQRVGTSIWTAHDQFVPTSKNCGFYDGY
ncbi:hypothetical protein TIFTF001_050534, partial [Ficus carica]